MLVAAVSFVLLTSASTTSALEVSGTVGSNFRAAYDILVRPPDSYTPLELDRGLVRDNYLSGLFGGISDHQWQEILQIPGVETAAPVANVGYIFVSADVPVVVSKLLNDAQFQLYRFTDRWVANRGMSSYPGETTYAYFTRHDPFVAVKGGGPLEVTGPSHDRLNVCDPFTYPEFGSPIRQPRSPFDRRQQVSSNLSCFSAKSPGIVPYPLRPGQVGTTVEVRFPMMLTAIDPVQEARLVGLDRSVVSGRPLQEQDGPTLERYGSDRLLTVPVLASSRTFVDERVDIGVERLQIPHGADVPRELASDRAFDFVTHLRGQTAGSRTVSPQQAYQVALRMATADPASNLVGLGSYRSVSPTEYREQGPSRLTAVPTTNPPSIWRDPVFGIFPAPPGNEDVQFRRVTDHFASMESIAPGASGNVPGLKVVGTFDPGKLEGFSSLSEVPLESYVPPRVEPANSESVRALHGGPLLPTMNVGGYLAQPPSLFTTMNALNIFDDHYSRSYARAPIGVIRVRVAGVTGPDERSLARIRQVALEIHQRTGLAVDITAGSSPSPLLVHLAPGRYGQPGLLVREGWTEKGVAVVILTALDRKSLLLFLFVLLVCGFFLVNAALASIRSRRREIGVLLCIGWSQGKIFRAVLGELVLVGSAAGVLGAALAAMVAGWLSLTLQLGRALLVIPIALSLALSAGLIAARRASSADPMDVVSPAVTGRTRGSRIRHIAGMSLVNLRRVPGRAALASGALAIGVAALAALLAINAAFQDLVLGTLLGSAVSVQVRAVDFVSVSLVIALAGLSVADVIILNSRERTAEFATLRAAGWTDGRLARLLVYEGIGIGLFGTLVGALVGGVIGSLLHIPLIPVVEAVSVAALIGVVLSVLASAVPAAVLMRSTPRVTLGME
jgi:putative ABC transport system permease protein